VFDHVQVWVDISSQNDDDAAIPALIDEMADGFAQARCDVDDYNGVTLCNDEGGPIYLSTEAMSAALQPAVSIRMAHFGHQKSLH
jgi:hypothetical protein